MIAKKNLCWAVWGLCFCSINPHQIRGQETAGVAVDVILALDNSGSMKKNDPRSLMRHVVSDFASRLSPNSQLGIVRFDKDAQLVMSLTPVNASASQELVTKTLRRIDYSGQRTDIPGGVERAIYELREHGRPNAQRIVVLFTDGIVDLGDPAKDLERSRWMRDTLALEANRVGIKVFGIAFTEEADFELIQSVSETTGGDYFRILSAKKIPSVFDQIGVRIRELTGANPEAKQEKNPPVSSTSPLARWGLVLGGAVVLLVLILGVARMRSRKMSEQPSVPATLRGLGGHTGEELHPLKKPITRIGRDPETNEVAILHDTVSAQHATIEFRDGSFYLRDLRSSNGTFLNGRKFSDAGGIREVMLKHGDRIRFDAYEFEFTLDALRELPLTKVAGGPAAGRTRLRSEPPQVAEQPGWQQASRAVSPPPAQVGDTQPVQPANLQPAKDPAEAGTRMKPDMCPNHPAWKATELCPECRVAKCKQCMTEKNGKVICTECAKKHER